MAFNFKSKVLFSFFLFSLSLQIVDFAYSKSPDFTFFNIFENVLNRDFGKFLGKIQVAVQDSNMGISPSTTGSNPNRNELDASSESNQNILELLEIFRIAFLLLGIMVLILSYKILKTLEIYEFYNTDKDGIITFRDEKGFEKHKTNAKKGKFLLFLGLAILLFGVYLFF